MLDESERLLGLIGFLLVQLENTLHTRDSALQVLLEIPDWKEKLRVQNEDPLRRLHTDELVQGVRQVILQAAEGEVSSEELVRLSSKLRPAVH